MDAFEAVVASILQRQGYWTLTSYKVELTKAEKREIGRHSSPRWELDVVAYRGRDNELRVVECKAFVDFPGVDSAAFNGTNALSQSATSCSAMPRFAAWFCVGLWNNSLQPASARRILRSPSALQPEGSGLTSLGFVAI